MGLTLGNKIGIGKTRQGSNSNQDYSDIIAIINSLSGGSDVTYEDALSTYVQQYGASGEGDIPTMLTAWSNRISITED